MTRTQTAILAGGCFWGMQDLIRKRDGVIGTRVGYTGGDVSNATYRNHGTHAEAIEIQFDPGKVVTDVEPAGPFWEAEPEHQDYLKRYPNGYTCSLRSHRLEAAAPSEHGASGKLTSA
jgi:peptide methionine sulfoxide reductase MsrA